MYRKIRNDEQKEREITFSWPIIALYPKTSIICKQFHSNIEQKNRAFVGRKNIPLHVSKSLKTCHFINEQATTRCHKTYLYSYIFTREVISNTLFSAVFCTICTILV